MPVKHVYRGANSLSLVFHAPSWKDPTSAACYGGKVPLNLDDSVTVELAVKAQAMCRRTACQNRIPPGLRKENRS